MALKEIHFLPEVSEDLREAYIWYEEKEPGFGLEFIDEVYRMFQYIQENPLMFAIVVDDIRRARIGRFPYGIFYVDEQDCIAVHSVLHLKRNPESWTDRL